jgi:hypothetical protein
MTIDEEERRRIEGEATQKANLENRVAVLETKVKWLLSGLGAAAVLVLTSMWENLKEVLFK